MQSMEAKRRDLLLSDLPDDILLHIFSFLQVNDILKLRVLSTRFNKALCIATPSFCFTDHRSHDSDPKNYCSCRHIFHFMINTVLHKRPHAFVINQISFSSLCNKDEHRDLNKQWIIRLFESFCVNELSLDYKLSSIFTSLPKFQSLKVLKLNLNQTLSPVRLPHMKLASLETIHIKSICLRYCSLDEWISESFPFLKHLSLQKINIWAEKQDFTIQSSSFWAAKQDFTIRSSTLEDLMIHDLGCSVPVRIITENLRTLNCLIRGQAPEHKTKFVLETWAPNLQSLTWAGGVVDLETLKSLQVNTNPKSLIMKESNWNVMIQLFKAIRSARELHIDTHVLKQWVRILRTPVEVLEDFYGDTLISLEDLRNLEIDVRVNIEGEDYITLLERLSNLETLTLVNYPEVTYRSVLRSHLEEERSVEQKFQKALRDCKKVEVRRTKGLKKVKMIIREMSYDDMIVIIGWLMKSCIDLEEISLHYSYCFDSFVKEEGLQYLQLFERASPHPPSFHFLPNSSTVACRK